MTEITMKQDGQIRTVLFISNYFNHHQKPFSDAMAEEIGHGYVFIETEEMTQERIDMGWQVQDYPSYVVHAKEFKAHTQDYLKLIETADAVIYGSASAHLLRKRVKENKIVFRYAEHQLKKGLELWKYPYRFFKWHREYRKNIYLLCASAYTASDFALFFLFKNRAYKWGYFPEVKIYDDFNQISELKRPASILWVARLIEWKHPEVPILIAQRLKEEGCQFKMTLIGSGPMEQTLRKMIAAKGLNDCVQLLGFMTPEEVRMHMENSEIFLFTSDRNEGWGAVLNEAMNSGCAVVANSAIGSVPYLLTHTENGFVYNNVERAYQCVKELIQNPALCKLLGAAAYDTIVSLWNPALAAKRLIRLIEEINAKGGCDLFGCGPCSRDN